LCLALYYCHSFTTASRQHFPERHLSRCGFFSPNTT